MSNLLEYFFGADPRNGDPPPIESSPSGTPGAAGVTFRFDRNPVAADLVVEWERTTDLVNWETAVPDSEKTLDTSDPTKERLEVTFPPPVASDPLFYRLKVTD